MNILNIVKHHRLLGVAMACALGFGTANAQDFPSKPIKIVVGAPAGSTPDLLARLLGQSLSEQWKQPVIVDNKPGATGMIGSQELIKAPADGHTLMINVNGIVSEAPHVIKVPFDYFKEVRPLVDLGRSSLLLVGIPQLPASDFQGLVNHIRTNPGKISYASYSAGTISHTSGLEMNKFMGLDMVHIAYRGAPPAIQDMFSGAVPLMFAGVSTVLGHVKNGKLKAFASSAPNRLTQLPDVPTFAELGHKSLTQSVWQGLWVRPSVPAPVQEKIRDTVLNLLQSPKVKEHMVGMGLEAGSGATPDELVASLRAASERHAATLRAINFKPE